jgi:hypothetical protein
MASRTESKARDAMSSIESALKAEYEATSSSPPPTSSDAAEASSAVPSKVKPGDIKFLKLDLSEPSVIQQAAKTFLEQESRLDILGSFFLGLYLVSKAQYSLYSEQRRNVGCILPHSTRLNHSYQAK